MSERPVNLLPQLVQDGILVSDLAGFSDHELRLGLMMLIDNFERIKDTLGLLDLTVHGWSRGDTIEKTCGAWDQALVNWQNTYDPEEVQDLDPEAPWAGYQTDHYGKITELKDLDRTGLEFELRECWGYIERVQQATRLMNQVMDGVAQAQWFDPLADASGPVTTPTTKTARHKP